MRNACGYRCLQVFAVNPFVCSNKSRPLLILKEENVASEIFTTNFVLIYVRRKIVILMKLFIFQCVFQKMFSIQGRSRFSPRKFIVLLCVFHLWIRA